MKHLLLAVTLLSLPLAAVAQSANTVVWCAPGATWVYNYGWFSEQGIVTVRYARDTVVAGQPAQVLTRKLDAHDASTPGSPTYTRPFPNVVTRTLGSRVEVLGNGQFYTLYNFAAQPGSSWLTPRVIPQGTCPTEVVQVVVDSVGTQLLVGRSLRWLRVHLTSPTGGPVPGQWAAGRIYEQVGAPDYMQPQSPICGGTDPGAMGRLQYYRATGWPAIGYNPTATTLVLGTAFTQAAPSGLRAYPNPSAGLLTLELPAAAAGATLRFLDLVGRTVRQVSVPATGQLEIRQLPPGEYLLQLAVAGQPPVVQRLSVR